MSENLKIVVPTDFSQESTAALEWVKRLAERGNAEVHCVNVVQQPTAYMPVMAGPVTAMPALGDLQSIAENTIQEFVATHLSDLEVSAVTKVLVGRPADEIADYAKQIGAQMIIIATRGQSGLAHIVLGSTAEAVVRQAECAVLTVRG